MICEDIKKTVAGANGFLMPSENETTDLSQTVSFRDLSDGDVVFVDVAMDTVIGNIGPIFDPSVESDGFAATDAADYFAVFGGIADIGDITIYNLGCSGATGGAADNFVQFFGIQFKHFLIHDGVLPSLLWFVHLLLL